MGVVRVMAVVEAMMTTTASSEAAPARVEVDTLDAQIECIRREISFRERVYPRWVRQGKLTQQAADIEMARMRAVLNTLAAYPVRMEWARVLGREDVLRQIPSSMAAQLISRWWPNHAGQLAGARAGLKA